MQEKPLHQQIREKYQLGPASHMTHIANLRSIVTDGCLWSYNSMRGRRYLNLANDDVQAGRAGIVVPVSQLPLHNYVPLYLGFKTPMVACNQDQNESLVFLRVSLDILKQPGVIFSDGNARSAETRFHIFESIEDLSVLDPKAINIVKYVQDSSLKRRKQAEILVPEALLLAQVLDIICFSPAAAEEVVAILMEFGIKKAVNVNRGWYFLPPPNNAEAL